MLFGNVSDLFSVIFCVMYFVFILNCILLVIGHFILKHAEFKSRYYEDDYITTEDGEIIPYDEDTQE